MVSKKGFAGAVRSLLDEGFRFTVIGGTVVELALRSRDLGPDVDVFAEEPNALFEDEYRLLAEEKGWGYGQTWLGTPRLVVRVEGEEVPFEFYDNIHDFYVPPEILERAERVSVAGVRVRMVTVEDHIVLKANSGIGQHMVRLEELAKLANKGRLRVDTGRLREAASYFPDESVIIRRLRDAGFRV